MLVHELCDYDNSARSDESLSRDENVKDRMRGIGDESNPRTTDVEDVLEGLVGIVERNWGEGNGRENKAMETVGMYINWVDINLVMR